jgi:hypothetical protein
MKFRFPIVIIDEDFRSENTSGLGIRALASAIEKEGMEILGVTSYGDLSQFAQQQSRASGVHPVDRRRGVHAGPELDPRVVNLRNFIREIRFKNAEIPIYLYGETRTSQHIPERHPARAATASSTCSRTRRSSSRATSSARTKSYLDSLAPPFFRALGRLRAGRLVLVALPGPLGRRRVPQEPVGQMFHQFFGENMLRADVCNAVDELGQLLDHTGPVAPPSAMPRASSTRTTASSSPTARRRRTRWCGMPTSRPATSWWSTATATCRCCTRSP